MNGLTHLEPEQSEHVRFRLAVTGLGLGPVLFAAGELLYHQVDALPVQATFIACAGLVLWIGGILGQVRLLRPSADRLGLIGGAVALLGLVAVTNIMLLQLVFVLIERKAENYPEVIEGVFHNVLFVTYIFGPVFPLGLFLLGAGLRRLNVFPSPVTGLYLLGLLFFPVGRIAGLPVLIQISDLVIASGSAGIAWHLWKRPDIWPRAVR